MIRQTQGAGFKLAATAIIWGFSTGMLGICIPLVSVTDSGFILPLAVIIGASFTTAVVWLSFNKQYQDRDLNPPLEGEETTQV